MKFGFLKRRKIWIRGILILILLPIALFTILVALLYWKQDEVVQELVHTLNEDFEGYFKIQGSHISPFENFPYISIDLEKLTIYENDTKKGKHILELRIKRKR